MALAIGGGNGAPIRSLLRELVRGADRISIAVSYVQVSGWSLLRPMLSRPQLATMRLLCTDQLGLTDPSAIRSLMDAGIDVRAYVPTNKVFHPKVFLAHSEGRPTRFLLGSANLSRSALESAVEVDISGDDTEGELSNWFDAVFNDPKLATAFDDARLSSLELSWNARLKSRAVFQRSITDRRPQVMPSLSASNLVETAFSNLRPGVTPLNFDKAGNNVRQMGMIRELLDGRRRLEGKARSEMKLLGFVDGGQLNAFAYDARATLSDDGVALVWMRWLKSATDAQLLEVSPAGQLVRAKQAFKSFWTFSQEVTDFFIANSTHPTAAAKPILQTIELLSNTGRDLREIGLTEIRTLSQVLSNRQDLSTTAAEAVRDYLDNKGRRGWRAADRRLAVEAWQRA